MRAAELCAGYGGLALAIEEVFGAELSWVAEVDPAASAVLAARWPGAPNVGDITTADWSAVERVDVMGMGFPCQDLSYAGKGAGLDGDRSGLWFDCLRAVRALQPRWVVVENVNALVRRGLHVVTHGLAESGYVGAWTCVRASDVGACHRRERVFLVAEDATGGVRRGEGRDQVGGPVSIGPAGGIGGPGEGAAADAIGEPVRDGGRRGVPGPAGAVQGDGAEWQRVRDADRLRRQGAIAGAQRHDGRGDSGAVADAPHLGRQRSGEPRGRRGRPAGGGGAVADATRGGYADQSSRYQGQPIGTVDRPSHRTGPRDSAEGTVLAGRSASFVDWGLYAPAIARHERAIGRHAPDPVDGRGRLSPRFVEWMMMLPDGWVTDVVTRRTAALRVLGNGVCPPQAAYALRLLLGEHQAVGA